LTSHLEVPIF